ncbi:MAG: response regulator transcription factor [Alphaproteobacteria bacterium]|nr:response regulator transcription factor [Alphaproteobacteria bacterium]
MQQQSDEGETREHEQRAKHRHNALGHTNPVEQRHKRTGHGKGGHGEGDAAVDAGADLEVLVGERLFQRCRCSSGVRVPRKNLTQHFISCSSGLAQRQIGRQECHGFDPPGAAVGRKSCGLPAQKRGRVLSQTTRILIADDHPLVRGALRQAVTSAVENAAIEECGDLEQLGALLEKERSADLVLLDLNMPGVRGFSGLLYLRAQYPDIPVVIVSASEDADTIRKCMGMGASGFIPKSTGIADMRDAIQQVLDGGIWTPAGVDIKDGADAQDADLVRRLASLTPQQVRVLMMLSEGLLNKQIAYKLSVSEATVKAHVSAILQKLGVDSRTQAVIAASRIEAGQWQAGAQ